MNVHTKEFLGQNTTKCNKKVLYAQTEDCHLNNLQKLRKIF